LELARKTSPKERSEQVARTFIAIALVFRVPSFHIAQSERCIPGNTGNSTGTLAAIVFFAGTDNKERCKDRQDKNGRLIHMHYLVIMTMS
jgi:hypothetical protein